MITTTRRILKTNTGAALIEFAIVVVLLVTMLFGIIEFGLMMKDYLTLNQAAREGARSAALGSPVAVVKARTLNSALTLNTSVMTIGLYKRSMWLQPGAWEALGDTPDGSYNNALPQHQVRVSLSYPHTLVTGKIFSWLAGGGATLSLGAEMIMRRE